MFQCHRCFQDIKKTTHYFDVAWVSVGHIKQTVWQDSTIRYSKDVFLKGLPMGQNTTSGKCMLLFAVHIDNGMRFVNNGPYAVECKNGQHTVKYTCNLSVPASGLFKGIVLTFQIKPNSNIFLFIVIWHVFKYSQTWL